MNTNDMLRGSIDPRRALSVLKYNIDFKKEHPEYFEPEGLLIFCGGQGSGKTLTAVQYIQKLMRAYPEAILCTNTAIKGLPETVKTVPYDGVDCLKRLENGYKGVVYFIDEIHLEFNSLESKNIDIEVMIEIAQQRKQRKHIVGTTQVYGRMAKPLREQIRNVVLCEKYFGCLQRNQLIDGFKTQEVNGKLVTETKRVYWFFHSADLYKSYDTYEKMKRYKKEWKGRKMV